MQRPAKRNGQSKASITDGLSRYGNFNYKDKTGETVLTLWWDSLYWLDDIFILRRPRVVRTGVISDGYTYDILLKAKYSLQENWWEEWTKCFAVLGIVVTHSTLRNYVCRDNWSNIVGANTLAHCVAMSRETVVFNMENTPYIPCPCTPWRIICTC